MNPIGEPGLIICYSQNFLFIKTRKTAGTSVEIALSRVCDDGDVVTPLSKHSGEEELRRAEGGHAPCNWQKRILYHRTRAEWRELLLNRVRTNMFTQHSTAADINKAIGKSWWAHLFKFTIERNPWDRAVSRYYWEKQRREERFVKVHGRPYPGITESLRYYAEHKQPWLSNWGHYTIDDRVAVDKVLFYERLSADLENLKRQAGIEGDISLPERRAKTGFRPDGRHYSEILSAEDRELVARVCRREIAAFGYRFETSS